MRFNHSCRVTDTRGMGWRRGVVCATLLMLALPFLAKADKFGQVDVSSPGNPSFSQFLLQTGDIAISGGAGSATGSALVSWGSIKLNGFAGNFEGSSQV